MKDRILARIAWSLLPVSLVLLVLVIVFRPKNPAEQPFREPPLPPSVRRTPVVRAIESVLPSVVNLSSTSLPNSPGLTLLNRDGGEIAQPESQSIGSGCIIDPSGLIITNAHVVHYGSRIDVTLSSGVRTQARLLAEDPVNDIALLKIDSSVFPLTPIRLARVSNPMLGESVIAVGNPFGLDGTITVGVLSGIGRSVMKDGKILFSDLLQTDAAVFPGSSGGPLVNLDAEMIGMNTAVKRNAPGIGFAIPLLRLENVLASFLIPERMRCVNLGVLFQMQKNGAIRLARVFRNSPAEKAGLKEGMILKRFQGKVLPENLLTLSCRLMNVKAGERLRFTFQSRGDVCLIPLDFQMEDGERLAELRLSLGIQNLTLQLASALGYPLKSGVVIHSVPPGFRMLKRGDLLIQLNSCMIHSVRDVTPVLREAESGSLVTGVILSREQDPSGETYLVKRRIHFPVR